MPITPFLKGEKFDAETTRAMGAALEMACVALRTGDCAGDVKQAIANKIIALANAGERNPDALCEQVIEGHSHGASLGLRKVRPEAAPRERLLDVDGRVSGIMRIARRRTATSRRARPRWRRRPDLKEAWGPVRPVWGP